MESSTSKLLDLNNRYSKSKTAKEILMDLIYLKKKHAAEWSTPKPDPKPLLISLVLGVSAVFIGLFAEANLLISQSTTGIIVVTSILVILITYFIFNQKSIKKLDIEKLRYECGISLLELLSEDISSKEKLKLKIQFGSVVKPEFLVTKRKSDKKFIIEERCYSANWLELTGRFVDKTKFKLQCKINTRVRVKRNARGKVKRKTDSKGNTIILSVVPNSSKGSRLADLPEIKLKNLQLPIKNCDLKKFEIDDKRIVIGVKNQNHVKHTVYHDGHSLDDINTNTCEIIMKLFLSAFNIINLNKKLIAQSPR